MKINGKGKAIGITAGIALFAALASGAGVHLTYRASVKGEGRVAGTTAAQIVNLGALMDRHQITCDRSVGALRETNGKILHELGELSGTVDAIWILTTATTWPCWRRRADRGCGARNASSLVVETGRGAALTNRGMR